MNAGTNKDDLPEGWVKKESRRHKGNFYYFNVNTGKSVWELPSASDSAQSLKMLEKKKREDQGSKLKPQLTTKKKKIVQDDNPTNKVVKLPTKTKAKMQSSGCKTKQNVFQRSSTGGFFQYKYLKRRNKSPSTTKGPNKIPCTNKMKVKNQEEIKVLETSKEILKQQKKANDAAPIVKAPIQQQNVTIPKTQQSFTTQQKLQTFTIPKKQQHFSTSKNQQSSIVPKEQQTLTIPKTQQSFTTPQKLQTFTLPKKQQHFSSSKNQQSFVVPKEPQTFSMPKKDSIQMSATFDTDIEMMEVDPPTHEEMMVDVQNLRDSIKEEIFNNSGQLSQHLMLDTGTHQSSGFSNTKNHSVYIVLDTNVLLEHLELLDDMKDQPFPGIGRPCFVIPWIVIQELDTLKQSQKQRNHHSNKVAISSGTQMIAQRAVVFLNNCLEHKHPRVTGQTPKESREIFENVLIQCNDDKILQCCVQWEQKYSNLRVDVVLFSLDKNLRNKALIMGLKAYSKESLIEWLKSQRKEITKSHHAIEKSLNSQTGSKQINTMPLIAVQESSYMGVNQSTNNMESSQYQAVPSPWDLNVSQDARANPGTISGERCLPNQSVVKNTSGLNRKVHTFGSPLATPSMIGESAEPSKPKKETVTDVEIVDEILCAMKTQLRESLSHVMEIEMKKVYGELWTKIIYKPQPWTFFDLMKCYEKHWMAVFGMIINRQAVKHVEELLQYSKPGKAYGISLQKALDIVQGAYIFCQHFESHDSYGGVIPKCSQVLSTLIQAADGVIVGKYRNMHLEEIVHRLSTAEQPNSAENQAIGADSIDMVKNAFQVVWEAIMYFKNLSETQLTEPPANSSRELFLTFLTNFSKNILQIHNAYEKCLEEGTPSVNSSERLCYVLNDFAEKQNIEPWKKINQYQLRDYWIKMNSSTVLAVGFLQLQNLMKGVESVVSMLTPAEQEYLKSSLCVSFCDKINH